MQLQPIRLIVRAWHVIMGFLSVFGLCMRVYSWNWIDGLERSLKDPLKIPSSKSIDDAIRSHRIEPIDESIITHTHTHARRMRNKFLMKSLSEWGGTSKTALTWAFCLVDYLIGRLQRKHRLFFVDVFFYSFVGLFLCFVFVMCALSK